MAVDAALSEHVLSMVRSGVWIVNDGPLKQPELHPFPLSLNCRYLKDRIV